MISDIVYYSYVICAVVWHRGEAFQRRPASGRPAWPGTVPRPPPGTRHPAPPSPWTPPPPLAPRLSPTRTPVSPLLASQTSSPRPTPPCLLTHPKTHRRPDAYYIIPTRTILPLPLSLPSHTHVSSPSLPTYLPPCTYPPARRSAASFIAAVCNLLILQWLFSLRPEPPSPCCSYQYYTTRGCKRCKVLDAPTRSYPSPT